MRELRKLQSTSLPFLEYSLRVRGGDTPSLCKRRENAFGEVRRKLERVTRGPAANMRVTVFQQRQYCALSLGSPASQHPIHVYQNGVLLVGGLVVAFDRGSAVGCRSVSIFVARSKTETDVPSALIPPPR